MLFEQMALCTPFPLTYMFRDRFIALYVPRFVTLELNGFGIILLSKTILNNV